MASDVVHEPKERLSTTLVLSIAALAMAVVAIAGEPSSVSPLGIAALLVGLVPWAFVAGGVRVPPLLLIGVAIATGAIVVIVDANPGGMFPIMIALTWFGLHTDDWRFITAVIAAATVPITVVTIADGFDENGTIYMVAGLGISLLAGRMIRRQQKLTAELEAMSALAVEHAAASERTHIAREVHDVVAHSLTVVMLHLTGARRVLATDPARADEALARAEKVGRESLDSIRQVVGLLRDGDGPSSAESETTSDPASPPQPGLADIRELIEGYRLGGLDVVSHIDLGGVDLDPATQLVVYRVVQESLSNALLHSPGSSCEVQIGASHHAATGGVHDRSTLDVVVVNSRPTVSGRRPLPNDPARSGLGVRGMRERVRAAGGSFDIGPTADGGWRVAATLPLSFATTREVTWPAVPTTP